MNLQEIIGALRSLHQNLGIPQIPQTNVVSPLFPGQFNYCLDEVHWYRKYGHITDITDDDAFQKIQPAIRLADFERYFVSKERSPYHLATFSLSTVNGARLVDREEGDAAYQETVRGMLRFLTEVIGLKKERLRISYFSGAHARDVEASRKRGDQLLKVEADFMIPADDLGKKTLMDVGLLETQLIANGTRDNFLTTNWDVIRAPWGYRNEILYQLSNGDLLDIATIERCIYEPVIEHREGVNFVVEVQTWKRCLVIDACGLERVSLATGAAGTVHDLPEFAGLRVYGLTPAEIESARILHRVYTDESWKDIKSKQRREKLNRLTRRLVRFPLETLRAVLEANAEAYRPIFPDLREGVERAVAEVRDYRLRQDSASYSKMIKRHETQAA